MEPIRTADPGFGDDARVIASILLRAGLADGIDDLQIEVLAGGVSADVVAVHGSRLDLVVKRALPRLKVEADWLAPTSRIVTEADALALASEILPGAVPQLVLLDDERRILVMERAPVGSHTWKDELLSANVNLEIATRLGSLLGKLHRQTTDVSALDDRFGDLTGFTMLRIDPFYGAVARVHPDLAGVLTHLVDEMADRRNCLVHGDYSPKNMLVLPEERLWVIDWEVAHIGDPYFDIAFMTSHLACKALRLPSAAARYSAAAAAFLDCYVEAAGGVIADIDDGYLASQVAALILARIDGKSRLDYLDEQARLRGRELARDLLLTGNPSSTLLWKALT